MNPLSKLLAWLWVVSAETYEALPPQRRIDSSAWGAIVPIPALAGGTGAGLTMFHMTDFVFLSLLVGLVCFVCILSIERALLAASPYQKSKRWRSPLAVYRVLFASLIDIVAAHAIVVLIFSLRLEPFVEQMRSQEIESVRNHYGLLILPLRSELESKQEELDELHTTSSSNPTPVADPLRKHLEAQIDQFDAELTSIREHLQALEPELAHFQEEYRKEVEGVRSGFPGEGPLAKDLKENEIVWRETKVQELRSRRTALEYQKQETLDTALNRELHMVEDRRDLHKGDTQSRILRGQVILDDIEALRSEVSALETERSAKIKALQEKPQYKDPITHTVALLHLFQSGIEGLVCLAAFTVVSLVLFLADMCPFVIKMFASSSAATGPSYTPRKRNPGTDSKLPPKQTGLQDWEEGHPVSVARWLQAEKKVRGLTSQKELAESLDISPEKVSTYLCLLKVDAQFQDQLLEVEDLGLESAAIICRALKPEHRQELLSKAQAGATSSELKQKKQALVSQS